MQAINTDKSSGLDHCYSIAFPHTVTTCNFFSQILCLLRLSYHKDIRKRKHALFPKWFYSDSTFYLVTISTFLVFSRFVSTSTYLISWHYHTTGGSNRAVTSPALFLNFGENGDHASCQATTADAAQRVDGEGITAGKIFISHFLSWTGLTQEQRKDTTQKDTKEEQF